LDATTEIVIRRRPLGRIIALALVTLLVIAMLAVWSQRRSIATGFIDRELARRGVQASYKITQLGFGVQRLEHVVVGDPAHPDLTARWVEVQLSYGLRAPRVHRIRARGVRMFARLVDGKLRLGQIDKLLPPPTGAPFELPELHLDLADAAMALDTPGGRVGLAVEGNGNLAGGFRGRVSGATRMLNFGNCNVRAAAGIVNVGITDRQPRIEGPVRAERLSCGNSLEVRSTTVAVNTLLSRALDAWVGAARIRSSMARFESNILGSLSGSLTFTGSAARTRGTLDLTAGQGRFGNIRSGQLAVDGRYDWGSGGRIALAGGAAVQNVVADAAALAPVSETLRSLGGTPIEPIGEALAAAVDRVGDNFRARGRFRILDRPEGMAFRLEQLSAESRSGARLLLAGGDGVTVDTATGAYQLDGRFTLSGGRFPSTEAFLRQPRAGAPIQGILKIAPMSANGARLALQDVRFGAAGAGTTRVDTVAIIDGPLNDGHVAGLVLPVRGRFGSGGFAFGEQCTPLTFRSLRYTSLQLGATRLSLCPVGPALISQQGDGAVRGGADIAPLRLSGRLGSSPITLASNRFRLLLDGPSFTGNGVAVRLGGAGYVNRLDLASLTGRFTSRGLTGTFAGGDGKIANVPLLLSNARGRWQVVDGRAAVDTSLTIADEASPARFHPLGSDDFHLILDGNRLEARGWLNDPQTGTRVTLASINHALDSGRGRAELDVPGITFSENYQPEELTPLTVGVIALVDGVLKGKGEIEWSPEGTTSSGSFSTEDMDLAAPFGPLNGLTTTINFTDLLALATAPGQVAQIERIQAGIDVFDGQVRYQLLPELKVKVEAGRWPFAGGELLLEETILDFSQESAKRLTFRLVGMDAATFVQQMEFSNISATGTFDGVIPMVFDQSGGRIVGGHLQGRPEGGVVSYVGELTDKQLGAYGKLAFDALKSLRYSKLNIELNGALDGEFVAGIELDGVARDPALAPVSAGGIRNVVAARALSQLAKIPFEFNITARGPFRALVSMMRSFEDPSALIQSVLPSDLQDQATSTTVQPQESETMR
jgi:translocation and assembly module TamB